MKKYFCTNDQLGLIMDRSSDGGLDWERYGFSTREIVRAVSKGIQGNDVSGDFVSVLPISDEIKFNLTLGNLVALGKDGSLYYSLLTEEQAGEKLAELSSVRLAQEVNNEK